MFCCFLVFVFLQGGLSKWKLVYVAMGTKESQLQGCQFPPSGFLGKVPTQTRGAAFALFGYFSLGGLQLAAMHQGGSTWRCWPDMAAGCLIIALSHHATRKGHLSVWVILAHVFEGLQHTKPFNVSVKGSVTEPHSFWLVCWIPTALFE